MDDQTTPQKPAPKAAQKVAPSLDQPPAPVIRPVPTPTPAEVDPLPDDSAYEGSVENDKSAHYRAPQAHTSSSWIQGPGATTLLAEAGHSLIQVALLRGEPEKVEFIRALALPVVKTVLIWPTDEEDLQKIPVTWRGGQASFNISEVLIRAKLQVESGRRHRYTVRLAKETKYGPALAIEMRFLEDIRIIQKGGSKDKANGKQGETSDTDDIDLNEE